MQINFNSLDKVFIIAEIGNNHEGSLSNAKKLITLAAKAGVDAVKFQTFIPEDFVHRYEEKKIKKLKKFQLSFRQFRILKKFAHKYKLKFISTPLDLESVKFVIKECDILKVASGDNNFFLMIEKLINSKKNIIISTGLTSKKDLDNLIFFLKKKMKFRKLKNKICLLHCVSDYPVDDKYANLNSIPFLKKNYKLNIGYSDHTIGPEACIAAVSLGAKIIEKHFTLDKNFSNFRDHLLSADFVEMKYIVKSIRKIEKLLGKFEKKIQINEKKNIKLMRRSIYASKKIIKNQYIEIGDLKFLRPQLNNSILNHKKIIGRKVRKTIEDNKIVKLKDLY